MKHSGILNDRLSGSLAALGHGDILLVVDAGFPIPRAADRIDLAITRDLPDLRTVLQLVHAEIHVERVLFAREMAEHNQPLDSFVRAEFAEAELDPQPHADMLGRVGGEAKTIVRTGAFDPWGNIGLICGVDVGAYFSKDGVTVPESYRARFEAATAGWSS
jgi:simple sugar transport system permease protein/D-ribose pyranase